MPDQSHLTQAMIPMAKLTKGRFDLGRYRDDMHGCVAMCEITIDGLREDG
jgi:hypothetical protein